jgi:hypothetical protein
MSEKIRRGRRLGRAWNAPPPGATVIDLRRPEAVGLFTGVTKLSEGDFERIARGIEFQRAPRRAAQRKGGRAPKRKPGIWERVRALVQAHPQITAPRAWASFPEAAHRVEWEGLIYRDGDTLVEVDDRTGRSRSITYQTFRRYVTDAKKLRGVRSN